MPYSPPAPHAANFICSGVAYTSPGALAANFTLPGLAPIQGAGAFEVGFSIEGAGVFTSILVDGAAAFELEFVPAGVARHGIRGDGSVAIDFAPEGIARHGVRGAGDLAVDFTAGGHCLVVRYELLGEVRKDGILVNRLVRAYRRDTGELVGEALTTGGKFRVSAGFDAREHYVVPIDMANDATDWLPPTANRIISELAQDAV